MRIAIALVAALVGCGDSQPAPAQRSPTEQRVADSTIGASGLPGAGGVNKALAASDSAKARNRALDSIANFP